MLDLSDVDLATYCYHDCLVYCSASAFMPLFLAKEK